MIDRPKWSVDALYGAASARESFPANFWLVCGRPGARARPASDQPSVSGGTQAPAARYPRFRSRSAPDGALQGLCRPAPEVRARQPPRATRVSRSVDMRHPSPRPGRSLCAPARSPQPLGCAVEARRRCAENPSQWAWPRPARSGSRSRARADDFRLDRGCPGARRSQT